jgi:PAS domain S-box-containing protein
MARSSLIEGLDFRWLAASATDAMLICDRLGRILYCNPATERLFGYAPEALLGQAVEALIPERFRAAHSARLAAYGRQPSTRPMGAGLELLGLRKDGSELPVDISLSLLDTEGGPVVLATIHDITRRRRAEQELAQQTEQLRTSEARLRAILDTAIDGIIVIDEDGRIGSFNAGAERMFRYREGEVSGKNISMLMPPPHREAHDDYVASYLETGIKKIIGRRREIVGRRKDGTTFPLELGVTEMQLGGRRLFTGITRDITERREAEERQSALLRELEAKNAELERFAYTVSHDLKSPLITIQGFSGLIEQSAARGEFARMHADIGRIRAAADKMQALLDDLLDLSRIGRLVHPPQRVSLAELAREVVELIAPDPGSAGICIDIAPDLPVIVGDRPRLFEILQNLVDNAIKFTADERQPRIEIGAREEAGETVCYVRDNGIGIDPRYHAKVFGLFERLDQGTEGTGIGLAIVKRIIELHGGRVWVESEGQGRGSTFFFALPMGSGAPPDEV